jgi:hypothetical protein
VGGKVNLNGMLANPLVFVFYTGNLSDQLIIGGDFLKGTGANFTFDFLNASVTGTFVLASWAGSSNFSAGDFSFSNMASGYSGSFAINSHELSFTSVSSVPEPSTYAVLFGFGAFVIAGLRHRRQAK